jgi:hypothetical protein
VTQPKIRTEFKSGSRWYVDPDTKAKVPGVTSVVGMLPKPFLVPWAAKLAATYAVDNLAAVTAIAEGDRLAAIDLIKMASRRFTAAAGEIGTSVHGYFEERAKGNPGRVTPDIAGFVPHIEAFLTEWKPKFLYIEDTVWSDTFGYAGSFDCIVEIGGEKIVLDLKTSASGVHAETALQLAAYRHADRIVSQDNIEVPKDIVGGAVLHVRPDTGYSLVPISCGDAEMDYFKTLLRVFTWEEHAKSVIGKPLKLEESA